jgi:hypothetical protein
MIKQQSLKKKKQTSKPTISISEGDKPQSYNTSLSLYDRRVTSAFLEMSEYI